MMREKGLFSLVSALALVSGITGCSEINPIAKMDAMNNAMAIMGRDVNATNLNTDAMTSNMNQGVSLQIRDKMIERMEAATTLPEKILSASLYFEAFESQLKQGYGKSSGRYDKLFASAVHELFVRMQNYANTDSTLDTSATSTDANMQNLYALSAGMGLVNPNNESADVSTILTIIQDVLSNRDAIRSNEGSMTLTQKTVLENEREAVYLLQLRSNFLPVMALGKISTLGDGAQVVQLWNKLWKVVVGLGWDTRDLNQISPEKLSMVATWLNEATRVHLFLKGIGEKTSPDPMVIRAYSEMHDIHVAIDPSVRNAALKNDAIAKIRDAIRIYVDTVRAN